MNSLRLAISFLTIFPVAPRGAIPFAPARAYFPLVGLGLGGILAGLEYAASLALPSLVVGALLLLALLVLTRALHTEGFLDCCDGLFGAYTRERRLEILRDSHVGAFAVIGGVALLAVKWALLASIPDDISVGLLVAFPCLSRFGMVTTMAGYKYARDQGLGISFKVGARWWQIIVAFGIAAAAGYLLLGFGGLALVAIAMLASLGLGRWISRLLGGMTGDAYAAVNEVAEVSVLLSGIILFSQLSKLFEVPFW